ncbi:hypothetical protein VULLAG_LOCUS9077 [Vulpes lagopus]
MAAIRDSQAMGTTTGAGANNSQFDPWTQLKTLDSFSSVPYLSLIFLSPQRVLHDLPLKSSLFRIPR